MKKEELKAVNRTKLAKDCTERGCRVSVSTISRILSGQRRPSLTLATNMAKALRLSLDRLVTLLAEIRDEREAHNAQDTTHRTQRTGHNAQDTAQLRTGER